ncbi:MAG: diguanylate cyclase domain-containing protein [Oscillochloridaceae bacterium umkhey_bin13]
MDTLPTAILNQVIDEISDGVYVVDRKRRIIFWNRGAERITGYAASEVVGRACWHNLLEHVDAKGCLMCFNGCPLSAALSDHAPHETLASLIHRDGYRMPVRVRTRPLVDAAGVVWGAVETFSDATSETMSQTELRQLRQLALVDPLTELGNRRYMEAQIESALNLFQRYNWGFGLLMIEIDHLEQVYADYGQEVGDVIVRMVGATMDNHLHGSDTVGRWADHQFALIVRHVQAEQLRIIAEHLRSLVASSALRSPAGPIAVTLSLGATAALPEDTPTTLLERASQQLEASKQAGRNRVTLG